MSDDATIPEPEAPVSDSQQEADIAAFWDDVKHHAHLSAAPGYFGASPLEALQPPAWAFGGTPEEADGLLELVLEGVKTATATAQWDFENGDEPLPTVGGMSIILDGSGHPRALIATTQVDIAAFRDVPEEFARLEGEGDLSLEYWREVHERFFTEFAGPDHEFSEDMPVVMEQFELVWPKPD